VQKLFKSVQKPFKESDESGESGERFLRVLYVKICAESV